MADPSHLAKKLARLAAVQALYQNDYALTPVAQIIRHEIDMGFPSLRDEETDVGQAPEPVLFGQIVSGVVANLATLDEMLAGTLSANLSAGRMEKLLRMILRAGIYELHHHGQIAANIIINDYVDVAHAFFNGKEPGLVNGILDRLAGKLRAA
jgi:N utilization substance protein B